MHALLKPVVVADCRYISSN